MIKIIVKFIILFINLIFLNNDINSCCCKENRTIIHNETENEYQKTDETKNTEINNSIFLTNNTSEKEITLTQEQTKFSEQINKILPQENKNTLKPEQIILLHQFTLDNNIQNINKIEIESMENSSSCCIKVNINDNICYIKEQSKSNEFFFEALKLLGLLDFKYSFTENYILTEHVDQNINNLDINKDYLILGKDLNPKNLKNMLSKIKNFKEYNFFCALLGLVDCDLIYRLNNSYFKKDGEKYKVFLLDVDSTIETLIPHRNDVHANKFYNILATSTSLLTGIGKISKQHFFRFDTNEKNINLIGRAISFTVCDEKINLFHNDTSLIAKYSKSGKVNTESRNIIKERNEVNNENFINYVNDKSNIAVKYRPKKNYEDESYPKNITFSICDMFEDFIEQNPKLTEAEQEKTFIEYILPILFKTIITKEIINSHKKSNYKKKSNDKTYFTDFDTFKNEFYKNYYGNKDNLHTINNYYLDLYIIRPKVFDEIMEEKNFSDEENGNIRQKLIKLIDFVKENENKYNQKAVQILKNNFKFLKDNNMYHKIINGIDL